MGRRRQRHSTPYGDPPEGTEWLFEATLNNRKVTTGTRLKFRGERGEFRFIKYVKREQSPDWIDVFDKNGQFRAFYVDRLKTVKNKSKRERAREAGR